MISDETFLRRERSPKKRGTFRFKEIYPHCCLPRVLVALCRINVSCGFFFRLTFVFRVTSRLPPVGFIVLTRCQLWLRHCLNRWAASAFRAKELRSQTSLIPQSLTFSQRIDTRNPGWEHCSSHSFLGRTKTICLPLALISQIWAAESFGFSWNQKPLQKANETHSVSGGSQSSRVPSCLNDGACRSSEVCAWVIPCRVDFKWRMCWGGPPN